MENKDKIIFGGMGVMFLWLCLLSYNVFTSGVSSSTIAQTNAIINSSNPMAAPAPAPAPAPMPNNDPAAIKPVNSQTQPIQNTQQPQVDPATAAKIAFEETSYDFGTIKEGEKVEHIFKFSNTSSNPLIITNAKGSCGCTVPEWPKEPIAPGASSEIKVSFDSKGKKGPNTKNVTITANTIPANTILTISSDVIKLDENGQPEAVTPPTK